jgi:hypothetical protein
MTAQPADKREAQNKILLDLATAKIVRLEDALEQNWLAHLILAGIGLALVFNIANLPGIVSAYYIRGPYDKEAVAAILLVLLLYFFMKLGGLLSVYMDASGWRADLLNDFDPSKTLLVGKSSNFFIEAFSDDAFRSDTFRPYLFMSTAVVTLAQSAAVFLVVEAYGTDVWLPAEFLACGALLIYGFTRLGKSSQHLLRAVITLVWAAALGTAAVMAMRGLGWSPAAQLISEAALITLYLLFWHSNRLHRQSTPIVLSTVVLATGWLVLFAFLLQGQQKTPTAAEVLSRNFDYVNNKILEMAEDFPADKYNFKLTPEMRTFGAVIVHIASGDIYAAKAGNGQSVKWDDQEQDPAKFPTKADCAALLKKSIDDANQALKANPEGPKKNMQPFLAVLQHSSEHYGLLVAYYRANGLVPPESRPKK